MSEPRVPKVSIITVCYNSAQTIRDTIESVLSQNYPRIEYIIIDGASTDGTIDIVRDYGSDIDLFTSERDRGIYDAMNKGILAATGDIIGILNSDDVYFDSRVVTDLVNAMTGASADAAFGDLIYVDRLDTRLIRRYYHSGWWRPSLFRFGWMPAHPTFFIKREWYVKHGVYSLAYRIAADFEMLVRLLYRGRATYTHIARPLVRMRMGGISTRGVKQRWLLNREIVRACRDHGIWTSLPIVLLKLPLKGLELLRGRSMRRIDPN